MNNSFDDDFNFVFATTGKARAPRTSSSKTGATAGGGKRTLTPEAQRRALLGVTKRKPQVMVKITSFGKSQKAVADHLEYISRKGEKEVFDQQGDELSSIAERSDLEAREVLGDMAERLADPPAADDQAVKRRPRERVTMNLMLSMPEGTDTGGFELSVRDFLTETFPKNDHVFAFHDDRNHYHAHIVVSLAGEDGSWLNPRIRDLQEWRENFAEALEHRCIAAEATPAYSRGRGKGGYRRDVEETNKRGTRRRPARSPSYDADTESKAITERAAAWSRIGDHYAAAGDREAADAIRGYVADRFDYHPTPTPAADPAPVEALEPTKAQAQAQAVPTSKDATRVREAFADLARKREGREKGYRDNNDLWRFDTPAPLRAKVDDYNQLPREQRPAALAKIAADPETDRLLQQREMEGQTR